MYICNKIALSKSTQNEENNDALLRYFRNFERNYLSGSLFDFSTFNHSSVRLKSQSFCRFTICFNRFVCNFQNYKKINSFGFFYFDSFNDLDLDQYFGRLVFRNSSRSHLFWRNRNDHWAFDQLQITQKTQSLKSSTHGK